MQMTTAWGAPYVGIVDGVAVSAADHQGHIAVRRANAFEASQQTVSNDCPGVVAPVELVESKVGTAGVLREVSTVRSKIDVVSYVLSDDVIALISAALERIYAEVRNESNRHIVVTG